MLTRTSLSAVRALTFLGRNRRTRPWSPRSIAQQLGESPTYLAKVVRHLVRAGILKAHRGVTGGVVLHRPPEEVTLLSIVEACQGAILGDFCSHAEDLAQTCAFHQAGAELHRALVGVLSRWTLAHFLSNPKPSASLAGRVRCWLGPCPPLKSPAASSRSDGKPGRLKRAAAKPSAPQAAGRRA